MISLHNVAKRYENTWIFKELNFEFQSNTSYALIGNNGSGKSTLLRCIAGMHTINKGSITYQHNGINIPPEKFYKYYSFSAPGMEIIEDMTLIEFLQFHFQLKPKLKSFSITQIMEQIDLINQKNTLIRNFSSGMKQRVKLAQALFSDVPYVLIDEPCTNLDQKGFELYHQLIQLTLNDRTIIVASNDEREYSFVQHKINVHEYKK